MSAPLHVLHVIDTLAGGGAERMLVDIVNCCHRAGWTTSVCQTRQRGPLTDDLESGIPVEVLDRQRRFDWGAMRRFAAWVAERRPDVLHVHGRTSLSFVLTVDLLLGLEPALLFHDHYGKIDIDKSVPRWFRWFADRRVNCYVGVSETLAAWARTAGIRTEKIHSVTNYLDLGRFRVEDPLDLRAEFEIPPERPLGLVVCGLRHEKGIHVLVEALSKVQASGYQVLVIGPDAEPGYRARCEELARELGVEDRVRFLGQRFDVPRLLPGFDFAIMPSISESGPLVLIEYLVAGLPVVSTRTGEIAAVVAGSDVGLFATPGDPASLATGIDEVLSWPAERRREEGAAGVSVAQEHFDLGRRLGEWEERYQEARERRGR